MSLVLAAVGIAQAHTPSNLTDNYEIDGNIQKDGAKDDWANGLPSSTSTVAWASTDTRNADGSCGPDGKGVADSDGLPLLFCDPVAAQGDKDPTTFPGGAKESAPPGWLPIAPGSVTPKTDIGNVYVDGVIDISNGDAHPIFINAMERLPKAGDVHLDFEFNQVVTNLDASGNPTASSLPDRRPGDLLIAYDLGGGRNANTDVIGVRVFVAEKIDPSCTTDCAAEYDYDNPDASATGSGTVTGNGVTALMNTAPIDAGPWGSWDDHYNLVTGEDAVPEFSFAEAAIDVKGAGLPGDVCVNFVMVKSRASESVTSQLKDTTGIVPFPFCGGLTVQKYLDVDEDGEKGTGDIPPATDTAGDLDGWTFSVYGPAPDPSDPATDPGPTVCSEATTGTDGELDCLDSTTGQDLLQGLSPGVYTIVEHLQEDSTSSQFEWWHTDADVPPSSSTFDDGVDTGDPSPYTTDASNDDDVKDDGEVLYRRTVTIGPGDAKTVYFGNTCLIEQKFKINLPTGYSPPSGVDLKVDWEVIGTTADHLGATGTETLSIASGVATGSTGPLFNQSDTVKWSYYLSNDTSSKVTGSTGSSLAGRGYGATTAPCSNEDERNFPSATIQGTKYKDHDADGTLDTGNPTPSDNDTKLGLSPTFSFQLRAQDSSGNWTVVVKDTTVSGEGTYVIDSTSADYGKFSFLGVTPGTYRIYEVMTTGAKWEQTRPASGNVGTAYYTVTVGLGTTSVTTDTSSNPLDFLNAPLSDIDVTFTDLTGYSDGSISCVKTKDGTGATVTSTTQIGTATYPDASGSGNAGNTSTYDANDLSLGTYQCTIVVTDP